MTKGSVQQNGTAAYGPNDDSKIKKATTVRNERREVTNKCLEISMPTFKMDTTGQSNE